MGKYCSDCDYLNVKNSKCEGVYECKKTKEYTNACTVACQNFEKSYSRKAIDKQKLYDFGKETKNRSDSVSDPEVYLFLFLAILVGGLILKILGY